MLGLVLAPLLGLLAFLALRGGEGTPGTGLAPAAPARPDAPATPAPPAATEREEMAKGPAEAEPGTERVASAGVAPPPGDRDPREEAAAGPTLTLLGRFALPHGFLIVPAEAHVTVQAAGGPEREVHVRRTHEVRFEGLAPTVHRVRVLAAGYEHREQVLDLSPHREAALEHVAKHGTELELEQILMLWAERWVAVRVETLQGRPVDELARVLGLEPAQLLGGAFDVRARRAAPPPGSLDAPADAGAVTFHPERSHGLWGVADGAVGAVELFAPAPLWLGLRLNGLPLGWQRLPPGGREVTFRITIADLEASLATLRLAVTGEGGLPATDALVALVAMRTRTIAHPRAEQEKLPVGAGGELELARLVPGRYWLDVSRGETLLTDVLELAPGEVRDLGTIALPLQPTIDVQIVHADGSPARGSLEMGPYRPGESAMTLSPRLFKGNLSGGHEGHLPAPAAPAIVRAMAVPAHRWQVPGSLRSANVLLDPANLPAGALVLVVHPPMRVELTLPEGGAPGSGEEVQVVDGLDLIVAVAPLAGTRSTRFRLVPGAYRARLVDAEGRALDEIRFDVEGDPLEVRWP